EIIDEFNQKKIQELINNLDNLIHNTLLLIESSINSNQNSTSISLYQDSNLDKGTIIDTISVVKSLYLYQNSSLDNLNLDNLINNYNYNNISVIKSSLNQDLKIINLTFKYSIS
ncbi:6566_t:CDS:2, partial [Cetraspora pellucida]